MSIEDPVQWLVNGTTRVSIGLGKLAGYGLKALFLGTVRMINSRPSSRTLSRYNDQSEQTDNRHFAGCREVVLFFINQFGYIARECISREELEKKIDSGIEPVALAQEIFSRIEALPGIMLGEQRYGEYAIPVKQPFSIRERHTYIIGKSGSGKTNLIRNMILQDIELGNGIGVLAPELELLTEGILPYIPDHRIDDVVFVNPADTKYPIAFNPLHIDEDEDLDRKVADTMTIFKRVMGESGIRMHEIFRQSLKALMQRPGSTLLDISRLLSRENATLRNEIIQTCDEETSTFFRDTYPSYGKDAHLPVIHHISPLVSQTALRTLLCQPGRPFNFRRAMDEGKIILFNLSDGTIGEQASQLLGQLIVSKIQMAVMSRADTVAESRRPFYLYLDEFQTFTGGAKDSYANILSRARKYKFGVILAHQQTGQIHPDLLRDIFGNVSTMLSFAVSRQDADRLAKEYEVGNTPDDREFLPQKFLSLRTGVAKGKIDQSVFTFRTHLAPNNPDFQRAELVIERSRKNYSSRGTQDDRPQSPESDKRKLLPPKPPEDALPDNKPPDDEPPIDPSKVF